MKFEELLEKINIELPENLFKLGERGVDHMTQSLDPTHDIRHVERIFDDFAMFVEENTEKIREEIDFSVVTLAIIWHDSWKATRKGTANFFRLAWDELVEGYGSRNLFRDVSQDFNLESVIQNHIEYAIKVHARMSGLLPVIIEKLMWGDVTKESMLLRDFDVLDQYNPDRLIYFRDYFETQVKKSNFLKKGLVWYYHRCMNEKSGEERIHFDWAKEKFAKRKDEFFRVGDGLLNSLK